MITALPQATASILVVDDIPENIGPLQYLLNKRGYKVRCAYNGSSALEMAFQEPPDLILLDIDMPDISGYEVATRLKENKVLNEVPIIFLSANEDVKSKVRAFAVGGVDYVSKPFEFAEVDARITTHLKIRRLQLELEQSNRQLSRLNELRESLTAAAKFGMWWTYYQQFDCQSVEAECRRSALDFLHVLDKLLDGRSEGHVGLSARSKNTLASLRQWANDSTQLLPGDDSLNLTNVLLFLALFRSQIEGLLSSAESNTDQMVHPDVAQRLESYLMWRGHFPRHKTLGNLQEIMAKASASPTIVLVGDIRRSQDLMTYAISEQDFSARIVEFISKTRSLLDKHSGFFDKFTGDGFLGYFNEAICEAGGANYVDCFVRFLEEFTQFSYSHFREWVQFVHKLPRQKVGLAMGADLGTVSFQSLNHHVVAVGESIVWASRMASAANAEEVLANNMLYQKLRHRGDLTFETRESNTKAGESFQAWKLQIGTGK